MGSEGVLAEQRVPLGWGGWHSIPTAPCPSSAAQPVPAAQPSRAIPAPGTRDEIFWGWSKGVSGDSSMPRCGSSGVQRHPSCPKPGLPSGRVAACSLALAAVHSVGSCLDLPEQLQMCRWLVSQLCTAAGSPQTGCV